ncbi:MAG: FAD-dependent oxidoreductase, partial [Spirochaetota bacterium]
VANADYAHVELDLLDAEHRSYPERWWKRATVAPSMLVGFLGSRRRIEGLEHHNLYFASNWDRHFDAIFRKPAWPSDPCFYASATTRTEPSMAPPGGENLYLLVPIATELDDSDEAREALFDKATGKLESLVGSAIRDDLAVKRIYSQRDFKRDFNARDGSALGLSHTLFQTAIFRPSRRSKKVKGLYYAGQYTHPGIGVPMALIAAELVVKAIADDEAG